MVHWIVTTHLGAGYTGQLRSRAVPCRLPSDFFSPSPFRLLLSRLQLPSAFFSPDRYGDTVPTLTYIRLLLSVFPPASSLCLPSGLFLCLPSDLFSLSPLRLQSSLPTPTSAVSPLASIFSPDSNLPLAWSLCLPSDRFSPNFNFPLASSLRLQFSLSTPTSLWLLLLSQLQRPSDF